MGKRKRRIVIEKKDIAKLNSNRLRKNIKRKRIVNRPNLEKDCIVSIIE